VAVGVPRLRGEISTALEGSPSETAKPQLHPTSCFFEPETHLFPCYSDTTFYSVTLTPPSTGVKATLTISCVLPHQATPLPAALPQNAESIYMLWEGDLLAPLVGLSKEQKAKVQQVSVKVKTPTPRIVQANVEDGFEMNHSQGAALVSFTSKGSVADFEHQVRPCSPPLSAETAARLTIFSLL
jgi:hypothetical protein